MNIFLLLLLLLPSSWGLDIASATETPARNISTDCTAWSKNLNCSMSNQQLVDNAVDQLATGGSFVLSVTASTPLASSGGVSPNITIQQANGSQNGFLSSMDWNTFNNKQPSGNYLTSVTANSPLSGLGTSGSPLIFTNPGYITNVGIGTINTLSYWNNTNTIGSLNTSTYPSLTELSYVKGVTSSIQTQINSKGSGTVTNVATGAGLSGGPITGSGTLTLDLTHANTWTGQQIFNTSNVGIGSATPGEQLDVTGTIRASSNILIGAQSVCQANGTNCPASPSGANPSAAIGLSAVNGSATTYTRSDGTAALSQGIAPTWTAEHIFHGAPSIVTNGNVGIGSVSPGQILDVQGTARMTGFDLTGNNVATGYVLTAVNSVGIGTWSPVNLSAYVPYSGATGNVNLNSKNLTNVSSISANGSVTTPTLSANNYYDQSSSVLLASWTGSLFNLPNVNSFKMPTGASNSYVLTTDGSGNGTWQPSSGGGGNVGIGTENDVTTWGPSNTLVANDNFNYTNGNLGIGTLTPSATLSVNGTSYFTGAVEVQNQNNFSDGLLVNSVSNSNGDNIVAIEGDSTNSNSSGGQVAGQYSIYNTSSLSYNDLGLVVQVTQNGTVGGLTAGLFITDNSTSPSPSTYGVDVDSTTMQNYFGGNVGIGNPNPLVPLQVVGSVELGDISNISDGTDTMAFGDGAGSTLESQGDGSIAMGNANSSGIINSQGPGTVLLGEADGGGMMQATGTGDVILGVASEDATINSYNNGNAFIGQADNGAQVQNFGIGSIIMGRNTESSNMTASGNGSILFGEADSGGYIESSGTGTVAMGNSTGSGATLASGTSSGAIAGGLANYNSNLLSEGNGSIAFGETDNGGRIQSYGTGSVILGIATESGSVYSFGQGSVFLGEASSGVDINIGGGGAAVIGEGDNSSNMESYGSGSIVMGESSNDANSYASGSGSLISGYNNDASMYSEGPGTVVLGESDNSASMSSSGTGSIVMGQSSGSGSGMQGGGDGSILGGYDASGTMYSNGDGSILLGEVDNGGVLDSYGVGSIVAGLATESGSAYAYGGGAVFLGESNSSAVVDSYGDGSIALGEADSSAQVSSSGTGSIFMGNATGSSTQVQSYGNGDVLMGEVDSAGLMQATGIGDIIIGQVSGSSAVYEPTNGEIFIGDADNSGTATIGVSGVGPGDVFLGRVSGGTVNDYGTGTLLMGEASAGSSLLSGSGASGAIGGGLASGSGAIYVGGAGSIALGYATDGTSINSSSNGSIALGYANNGISLASAYPGSVALNESTKAEAEAATSMGFQTNNTSYAALALGQFNSNPGYNNSSWVSTDPVLIIGNGNSSSALSDADIILKNGNVGIGTSMNTNVLDVAGNVSIGTTYAGYNAAPINGLAIQGNVGIGTWIPSQVFEIGNRKLDINSNGNIGIGSVNPNNSIIVATGNVGIGTAFPGQQLDIGSSGKIRDVGIGTTVPEELCRKADGTFGVFQGVWNGTCT